MNKVHFPHSDNSKDRTSWWQHACTQANNPRQGSVTISQEYRHRMRKAVDSAIIKGYEFDSLKKDLRSRLLNETHIKNSPVKKWGSVVDWEKLGAWISAMSVLRVHSGHISDSWKCTSSPFVVSFAIVFFISTGFSTCSVYVYVHTDLDKRTLNFRLLRH